MDSFAHVQVRIRKLFRRDLFSPRFYVRRLKRQPLARGLTSFVQTKIPYSLPLPRLPYVINVEPTTYCNLRCIMCPSPALQSPRGYMSMSLYEKVLRQAVEGGAHRIRFVGLGEPLLHPDLPEMIRMAKRGNLYTEISTNATRLTRDLGTALLDAGLDEIGFSLDAADEAEFERIRKGASYREVMRNIEEFLQLCAARGLRAPVTVARMVVMDESQIEAFSLRWSGKVDSLQFNIMRVYAGAAVGVKAQPALPSAPRLTEPEGKSRCRQLMHHLLIGWDGRVGLCNQSSVIVGDATTTPLQEIWRGHAMQRVRGLHACYEGHRMDVCRRCPEMGGASPPDQGPPEHALVTLRRSFRDDQIAAKGHEP